MKVAYIFESKDAASYKLQDMILPQLQENRHEVEIELMFFFDENCHALRKGNDFGSQLSSIAKTKNIVLMLCDQCAHQRGLAKKTGNAEFEPVNTYPNVLVGCFPDVYRKAEERKVDQVITI